MHRSIRESINNQKISTKAGIFQRICLSAVMVFLLFSNHAFANLDSDISNYETLNSKSYQQQTSLTAELDQLDTQIASVNALLANTQVELNTKNNEITAVEEQITKAEADLLKQKELLQEYVKTMYINGQTSQIELILTSNSFSDFVDQSQYLDTMTQKVRDVTDQITQLKSTLVESKSKLEIEKAKIEQLKAVQQSQRQNVASQIENKNNLIAQTQGDQTKYQGILKDLYAARRRASIENGEVSGGSGNGGYNPSDWYDPERPITKWVDPWGFYNDQCTSYSAWYWNKKLGLPLRLHTVGNAGDWVTLAYDNGYAVSSSPQVGSVAIWPTGSLSRPASIYDNGYYDIYGHVAIVTAISGGTITVSEYNFNNPEAYGTRSNVKIDFTNGYGKPYSLSFINF